MTTPAAAPDDAEAALVLRVSGGAAAVSASRAGAGRGLFAAAAVPAGGLVFAERPLVAAPGGFGAWECTCACCGAAETDDAPLRRCARGCRWAHYCSDACAAADADDAHTAAECAAMAALKFHRRDPPACVVMAARLLRRFAAAAVDSRAEGGDDAASLRAAQTALARTLVGFSDAVPRLTLEEYRDWAPAVVALSATSPDAAPPTEEAAVHALCALLRNEFRLLDERGVATRGALFPAVARANHACAPTARAAVAPDGSLHVEALTPLARGDEVLISYVGDCAAAADESESAAQRAAAHLRARFLFDCACGAPACVSGRSS